MTWHASRRESTEHYVKWCCGSMDCCWSALVWAMLPSRSASWTRCSRLAYLIASWTVRESGINSHSSDACISRPDLHANYTTTHDHTSTHHRHHHYTTTTSTHTHSSDACISRPDLHANYTTTHHHRRHLQYITPFIVRLTYDSDLKRAKIDLRNITSLTDEHYLRRYYDFARESYLRKSCVLRKTFCKLDVRRKFIITLALS